jgi:long-chain acyl-CoA synthetase
MGDFLTAANASTLPGLLLARIRRTPDVIAYLEYDVVRKDWVTYTWRDMGRRAGRFRAALAETGLEAGERVGLLLPNCIDWVAFDMAAMSLGLAEIRDGRIFILGRLKDVVVLTTGEKVYPATIEAEILKDPLFRQAVVVGERRPYLAAILVLDREHWADLALRHKWSAHNPNMSVVRHHLLRRIANRLRDMPVSAQVRAVFLTLEPLTIEAGLETPTLKTKRQAVERRFEREIAELYLRD